MSAGASPPIYLEQIGGGFHPGTGLLGLRLPASNTRQSWAGSPEWFTLELVGGTLLDAAAFVWSRCEWPERLSAVGQAARIAAFFGVEDRHGIEVQVAIARLPGQHVSWQVIVANQGPCTVHAVGLSFLGPVALPAGWVITIPWGPVWALRAEDLAAQKPIRVRYPVQGTMQWYELFSPVEGISMGTLDGAPLLKDFVIGPAEQGPRFSVIHPHLWLKPGESLILPPAYLGVHSGDWQVGAAWYRRWLEQNVDRVATPHWLRRHPAWCWTGLKQQLAKEPDGVYADLPGIWARFTGIGFPCIQVSSWLEHGHDTGYPDFVAGQSLGGEEALAEAVGRIHQRGGFVALYTNGRIVDPASRALAGCPKWPSWAVRAPAGRRYVEAQGQEVRGVTVHMPVQEWDRQDVCGKEKYGAVGFAVMCPGCPAWQELFATKLGYLARRYGVDGIYIDQVLGAECLPCYATDHGHTKPNEAWIGYRELLRGVIQQVKQARPQAYLATEGISDILGQYFDIVQSHNDWRGVAPAAAFPMPEITRHVMPWLLQAVGPIREDDFFHLRLAHYVGSGMDIACRSIDPASVFASRLSRLAEWRRRLGPVFLLAEPVHCWAEGFPRHRATAVCANRQVVIYTADLGVGQPLSPMRVRVELPAGNWHVAMWETEDGVHQEAEVSLSVASAPGDGRTVVTLALPPHEMGVVMLELT